MRLFAATFNRITREDLRWHPYKINVRQQKCPDFHVFSINFAFELC